MGLRHMIPVVILIVQLHGLTEAVESLLPPVPGNSLLIGLDRMLPNASPINCGRYKVTDGRSKKKIKFSLALTLQTFEKRAFTAGPIGSPESPPVSRIEGKFTFAEVKGKEYVYALQVDKSGELAYWLPQGGYIDIPREPTVYQPKYVFTPDFSGSSWTVTPLANRTLRLRHVEANQEASQFNNLTQAQIGGNATYAMQYKDYGYLVETRRLVENVPSFAFMRYSGGYWTLNLQRKTCSSTLSGYMFRNDLLSSVVMLHSSSAYPPVSNTKTYRIP